LHYVLADEERYRRALSLVKQILALTLVVVGGLVTIAVLVPSTAQYIGTGLLAVLVGTVLAANGRLNLRLRNTSADR
jgi:uncharacterized membrane protein YczE